MKRLSLLSTIAWLAAGALTGPVRAAPPHPDVKAVMSQALADMPGKEALMLTVTYPPGGADPVHRHNAHAFVYVIEGSIVMQVQGKPAVTLKAGQSFYEAPEDIHSVGRNASKTKPAKFVVVLLKDQGAEALIPVP